MMRRARVLFLFNIVIGASIRYGKHNAKVYEFIKKNKKNFKKKILFFSVNVVARKTIKIHQKQIHILKIS